MNYPKVYCDKQTGAIVLASFARKKYEGDYDIYIINRMDCNARNTLPLMAMRTSVFRRYYTYVGKL